MSNKTIFNANKILYLLTLLDKKHFSLEELIDQIFYKFDDIIEYKTILKYMRTLRKFGYKIDYQRCTGCGICVQECPRNAMSMRKV